MTIGNSGNGGYANFNSTSNPSSEATSSKYSNRNGGNIISTFQFNNRPLSQSVQSMHLLDFPPEIIEKIFGYLSFKNICQLRLVSNLICIVMH